MAVINPRIARRERLKLKLSLEELGKRAQVNKATLHRIESGRMTRNAGHVIERLAKVFKVDPERLTSTRDDREDADEVELFSYRSQLNIRVSHEARNALASVAKRYGVRPVDIVEMAPLLFHIVAAESLKERASRLQSLLAARQDVEALAGRFPHITERLTHDWQGDELYFREERSIAARDIRGRLLDEGDDYVDARPLDYEDWLHNPFVAQLRSRLEAVQLEGEPERFESWFDGHTPSYEICREEAVAYLGGDVEAAEHLISGRVGGHEIPKELRGAQAASQRAKWVRERADELAARNVEWLTTLDVKGILI